jgi:hypothetical protein
MDIINLPIDCISEIVKNFNIEEFEKFINAFPIYKETGSQFYINCDNIDKAINLQFVYPNISFNLNLDKLDEKIKQVECVKLDLNGTHITDDQLIHLHGTNITELDLSMTSSIFKTRFCTLLEIFN